MANKVKDINHPSINDRERRVLEELGICNGAHFNNLLKIARYRLNAGYSHAETVLSLRCTGSYCQQRVKSDPLTATTNGLILIHLVYSGLASAITPAFRFCFSR